MCNLYRMNSATAAVADLFRGVEIGGSNAREEVYPGYPGLVVAKGEVRSMTWGFPLALTSKATGAKLKPKPVNNTRSDKLDSFMWRFSFQERRCLIPVNAFAEAEGPKGQMTRTWFSLPDQPLFAVAGIWRDTDEWGPAYSMVMTESGNVCSEVHSRMPVILHPDDWQSWTDGEPEEARALCVPYIGTMTLDRTNELWRRS